MALLQIFRPILKLFPVLFPSFQLYFILGSMIYSINNVRIGFKNEMVQYHTLQQSILLPSLSQCILISLHRPPCSDVLFMKTSSQCLLPLRICYSPTLILHILDVRGIFVFVPHLIIQLHSDTLYLSMQQKVF